MAFEIKLSNLLKLNYVLCLNIFDSIGYSISAMETWNLENLVDTGTTKKYTKKYHTEKRIRKDFRRCGDCDGCRAENCGKCSACLDMPKYGGPGKINMACT